MAEVKDDKVAGHELRQDFGPGAFLDVTAAAAAAPALVIDVDFGGVEKWDEFGAPAPRAGLAVAAAGFYDGIADEEQRRVKRGAGRRIGGRIFLRAGSSGDGK